MPQRVRISNESKVDLQYVFYNNTTEVKVSVTHHYFEVVVGHVTVYGEKTTRCVLSVN